MDHWDGLVIRAFALSLQRINDKDTYVIKVSVTAEKSSVRSRPCVHKL